MFLLEKANSPQTHSATSQLTLSELYLAISRFKAQDLKSSKSLGLPGNPANLTWWLPGYLKGLLSGDLE